MEEAIQAGRGAVAALHDEGIRALCLGELGIGNTASAAALLAAVLPCAPPCCHSIAMSAPSDSLLCTAPCGGGRQRAMAHRRVQLTVCICGGPMRLTRQLSGRAVEDVTGRGTGLDDKGVAEKASIISQALQRCSGSHTNPRELLQVREVTARRNHRCI